MRNRVVKQRDDVTRVIVYSSDIIESKDLERRSWDTGGDRCQDEASTGHII